MISPYLQETLEAHTENIVSCILINTKPSSDGLENVPIDTG